MDVKFEKVPPEIKIVKPDDKKDILLPGEFGAMLDWKVWDPKTGDITEQRTIKSRSYLQQFLQILFAVMGAVGEKSGGVANVRDIGNTLRSVAIQGTTSQQPFSCNAAVTVVTNGIIIGTGITAPTISDYKIETIIPHATMNYSAMTFGAQASDATTSQITLTRNFANVSGGPVTVTEVALYVIANYTPNTLGNFCIIRDAIAGGIAVPNGQTLTVNYRPQAVV